MPRTTPLEHDYIGLASSPSTTPMEINKNSPEKIPSLSSPSSSLSSSLTHENENNNNNNNNNNLKETELRLGLPGSESPERKPASCGLVSLFGKDLEEKPIIIINNNNKNAGECGGVKRGFSDVGSCGKWALSVGNGSSSEADLSIGVKPKPNSGGANKPSSGPSQPCCGSTQSQPPTMKELVPNPNSLHDNKPPHQVSDHAIAPPAAKAQVVGWPPIRSFRKNSMASNSAKSNDEAEDKSGPGCLYIKVSMDGAPYLRKVDLKTCNNYMELSSALEKMFGCFTIGKCGSTRVPERNGLTESRLMDLLHGSEYVVTYEDKDGDWMLVGDVPWVMFIDTCRRLRIMKGSEAIGLAPRSMEKSKSRN